MKVAAGALLGGALLACLLAGCRPAAEQGGAGVAEATLTPLPMPDLSAAEPGVQRQLGEAKARLDALAADPASEPEKLAEAYGELALSLMSYQLGEPARVALANAVRLAPEEMRWHYLLGYLDQLQGQLPEAATHLARSLELAPDFVPALVRLGRVRADFGDAAAARRLFSRALELDADSAAAHEGLGRLDAAAGEGGAAIRHWRRALELQPAATSLHYLLGQELRRAGDTTAARGELAQAGDAPVILTDPLVAPISSLAESAQYYVVQGSESLFDGKTEEAAASFRRALEIDPGNFTAHKALGFTLEKLGDLDGAIRQLRAAVEHTDDPREGAEAEAILGSLLASSGADAEAVGHLRRSLELAPERTGPRLKLADTLVRLGRFEEALSEYDRLLADGLEQPAAVLSRRAAVNVNLGRRRQALADFRRALDAEPDNPDLHLRYAEALDYLGDAEGARRERAAAEGVAGAGERVGLLAGEGRLATSRGDLDTAAAKYRAALELAPERFDVRYALASLLAHRQRWDEALAEYARVIAAAPDHQGARHGEIAALILSGRFGPARVRLNDALARFQRDKELALTQARLLAASPDPRVRDPRLAVEVAERVRGAHDDPLTLDTLAMAYAADGRYAEAVAAERQAAEAVATAGDAAGAAHLRAKLAVFQAGRPWEIATPAELLGMGPS